MSGFCMVVARERIGQREMALFASLGGAVAAQAEGSAREDISATTHVAAKTWLGHSRSAGFGRDGATGSWLACVGNPSSADTASVPQQAFASHLLGGYLAKGREAITSLNAPFAVVIFDGRDGSIHVVTDRLGLARMYMLGIDGGFAFSTSSLALGRAGSARLEAGAVGAYFQMGHLLGEMTMLSGISKVGAARWVSIREGRSNEETYWRPGAGGGTGGSLEECATAVAEASKEALDSALSTGAATTVELTGGLDSRLNFVSALATGKPFLAWTIADVSEDDTRVARQLASLAGVEHALVSPIAEVEHTFWDDFRLIHRLTEGEGDCLNVIASPSANRQSADLRVQSVTGSCGEILRGRYYRSVKSISGQPSLSRLIGWQLCLTTRYDHRIFAAEYADVGGENLRRAVRRAFDATDGANAYDRLDRFYLSQSLQSTGGCSMSFNNFFYRQVAPFCSNRMVELALGLPWRLKKSGLAVRKAIALTDGRVASLPLGTGMLARPHRLRDTARIAKARSVYILKSLKKAGAKLRILPGTEIKGAMFARAVNRALIEACRRELRLEEMASAPLYNPDSFRSFIRRNIAEGLPDKNQVGLILSMELTARYIGGNART